MRGEIGEVGEVEMASLGRSDWNVQVVWPRHVALALTGRRVCSASLSFPISSMTASLDTETYSYPLGEGISENALV